MRSEPRHLLDDGVVCSAWGRTHVSEGVAAEANIEHDWSHRSARLAGDQACKLVSGTLGIGRVVAQLPYDGQVHPRRLEICTPSDGLEG